MGCQAPKLRTLLWSWAARAENFKHHIVSGVPLLETLTPTPIWTKCPDDYFLMYWPDIRVKFDFWYWNTCVILQSTSGHVRFECEGKGLTMLASIANVPSVHAYVSFRSVFRLAWYGIYKCWQRLGYKHILGEVHSTVTITMRQLICIYWSQLELML